MNLVEKFGVAGNTAVTKCGEGKSVDIAVCVLDKCLKSVKTFKGKPGQSEVLVLCRIRMININLYFSQNLATCVSWKELDENKKQTLKLRILKSVPVFLANFQCRLMPELMPL